MRSRFIDETGNRYGMLTVVSYDDEQKKWLCKCDCGTEKYLPRRYFALGNTRNCGCARKKPGLKEQDLTGKTFAKLTAVEQMPYVKGKRPHWRCKCECGNETVLSARELITGNTKSCGCHKKQIDTQKITSYEPSRTDGVVMHLFNNRAQKNSSTGYRGVYRYRTNIGKLDRYRAWITVKGKKYYSKTFMTAEEAYYNGRLPLEEKYLPQKGDDTNA